jgi:hypothetical protein
MEATLVATGQVTMALPSWLTSGPMGLELRAGWVTGASE